MSRYFFFFFFQAEDGIRDYKVTEFRRVLFRSCPATPSNSSSWTGCGIPMWWIRTPASDSRAGARRRSWRETGSHIGRGPCRGRGEISGGAGSFKKKKKREGGSGALKYNKKETK